VIARVKGGVMNMDQRGRDGEGQAGSGSVGPMEE
jgi:hypothetical protein